MIRTGELLPEASFAGRTVAPTMARLALGTAQFGLPYGLALQSAVDRAEVAQILSLAWRSGIDLIDTAAGYGDAESIIGAVRPKGADFSMVSKTPKLGRDEVSPGDLELVADCARRSRVRLGVDSLDTLLVHHAPDLLVASGSLLFRALERLRDDCVVRRLGVSVYDPETLNAIVAEYPVDVVQLPLNIFDQRFIRSGAISGLVARGIEVHARSVFLQGLLLADPGLLPARFDGMRERVRSFQTEMATAGLSAAAAALGFAASCPGIARVVVGVDGLTNLQQNIDAFSQVTTAAAAIDDAPRFAVEDPDVIDPRRWPA